MSAQDFHQKVICRQSAASQGQRLALISADRWSPSSTQFRTAPETGHSILFLRRPPLMPRAPTQLAPVAFLLAPTRHDQLSVLLPTLIGVLESLEPLATPPPHLDHQGEDRARSASGSRATTRPRGQPE